MKRFLIALLVFTTFNSYAQNSKIDSLKQLLRNEIADTTRVKLLYSLAGQYWTFSSDSSLILAQQGLVLARQKGFVKGEAWCLYTLGTIFWLTGNYP